MEKENFLPIDALSIPVAILDAKLVVVAANKAWKELFRGDPAGSRIETLEVIREAGVGAELGAMLEGVLESRKEDHLELRCRCEKDTSVLRFSASFSNEGPCPLILSVEKKDSELNCASLLAVSRLLFSRQWSERSEAWYEETLTLLAKATEADAVALFEEGEKNIARKASYGSERDVSRLLALVADCRENLRDEPVPSISIKGEINSVASGFSFAGTWPAVDQGDVLYWIAAGYRNPPLSPGIKAEQFSWFARRLSDVSKLDAREKALMLATDLSGAILEAFPLACCLIDSKLNIVRCNRKATQLLGEFQQREVTGLVEITGNSENDELQKKAEEAFRICKRFQGEFEIADGNRKKQITYEIIPLPSESDERFGLFTMNETVPATTADVSDKKAVSKETLAFLLAHDIVKESAGILGLASNIRTAVSDNPGLLEMVELIGGSACRITEMISSLSDWNSTETEERSRVDLNSLLMPLVKLVEDGFSKDTSVNVSPGKNLKPVFVNPAGAERAIMTMLLTCRDNIAKGGKVELTTRERALLRRDDGVSRTVRYIQLELTYDSNASVISGENEELDKIIFRPVRQFAESAGGIFEIERLSGGMIRYRLLLPAMFQTVDIKQDEPPGASSILVVDDEKVVTEIMSEVLSDAGYEVFVAASGREALELLRKINRKIQVAIVDLFMPGLGGKEFAEKAREEGFYFALVLVSGYPEESIEPEWMENYQARFLRKPFKGSELLKLVKEFLEP